MNIQYKISGHATKRLNYNNEKLQAFITIYNFSINTIFSLIKAKPIIRTLVSIS